MLLQVHASNAQVNQAKLELPHTVKVQLLCVHTMK
jgi:hypothetical protein